MNAPLPNTELIESGPSTLGRVAAEAIANTLSGVGLGLLTGVALWAFGCTWPTIATWSAASAIAWAGAINWLRFSQDELSNRHTFWRMARDNATLEAENAALEVENGALADRIEWLEQRARQPLRINGVPQAPDADPAYRDAETLIRKYYGEGVPVALRRMQAAGWTQARYTAALDILKSAAIVEVRGTQTTWAAHPSPDAACTALHAASRVALHSVASLQEREAA